ncbi:hypothetical protein NDA13_000600 [Ustilago tritici]|nr:hypothetical protein NDA13_000600 [Ustilago tritici]
MGLLNKFRGFSGTSSIRALTSTTTNDTLDVAQLKAELREQSLISDIAEDDAIAAANVEHALQKVEAAKAYLEAASATSAGAVEAGGRDEEGEPQGNVIKAEGLRETNEVTVEGDGGKVSWME